MIIKTKNNFFFYLLMEVFLILSMSGCGIWYPIRGETTRSKIDLSNHVHECSETDPKDMRQCFSAYTKRINLYLQSHPEVSSDTSERMREGIVALGMSVEYVLVMVEPDEVIDQASSAETIFRFSDMGDWGKAKDVGNIVEILIKDNQVVKIKYCRSFYGL